MALKLRKSLTHIIKISGVESQSILARVHLLSADDLNTLGCILELRQLAQRH